MFKIHFHMWKEIDIVEQRFDSLNVSMTTYRYCKCGKWQKCVGNHENHWWEECENPNADSKESNKDYNVGE